MTELPISDGHGALLDTAWLFVLSVMSFPRDPDKALAFTRAVLGQAVLRMVKSDERARLAFAKAVERPGPLFELLGAAGAAPALVAEAHEAQQRGSTAAQVLSTVIRASAYPSLASVTKAVRLVMQSQGRGRSAVFQDWEEFKPTAHLYLAQGIFQWELNAFRKEVVSEALAELPDGILAELSEDDAREVAFQAMDEDVVIRQSMEEHHPQNLLYILSLSEKIRRTAEAHVAIGSTGPLLAPEEAFSIPKDVELGEVRWLMPALDDEDIKTLAARGDPKAKRARNQSG